MFKYCTKYVSRGCKLQYVVQFNLWIRNTMVSIWQLTRAFSNHSWILLGLEPFLYLFIGTEPLYIYLSLGRNPYIYPFHWDGTLIYISFWLSLTSYYIWIVSITFLSFYDYFPLYRIIKWWKFHFSVHICRNVGFKQKCEYFTYD